MTETPTEVPTEVPGFPPMILMPADGGDCFSEEDHENIRACLSRLAEGGRPLVATGRVAIYQLVPARWELLTPPPAPPPPPPAPTPRRGWLSRLWR